MRLFFGAGYAEMETFLLYPATKKDLCKVLGFDTISYNQYLVKSGHVKEKRSGISFSSPIPVKSGYDVRIAIHLKFWRAE